MWTVGTWQDKIFMPQQINDAWAAGGEKRALHSRLHANLALVALQWSYLDSVRNAIGHILNRSKG